jgi:hypothetical protein
MSREIHIDRDPPLSLSEWKAAVDATENVRLDRTDASVKNPKTGDVISIAGVDGDAHVNVGGSWHPCFRWHSVGSVAFRDPAGFTELEDPILRIAKELALRLNARLVGDEGEEYK